MTTHITLIPRVSGLASARHPASWQASRWAATRCSWRIWAARDAISPRSVGQRLAAGLPRARVLTFDSDDHWVARRFPRETAAAIQELHADSR